MGTNTTLSAALQCTAEKDSELRMSQMKCQIYEKVDDASCGENIFRVQWIYEANLDFSQMCTFAEGPCRGLNHVSFSWAYYERVLVWEWALDPLQWAYRGHPVGFGFQL